MGMHDAYRHEAWPYSGLDEFVASCVSLVQGGLGRDERLLLLASGHKIDGVREALSGDAEDVTFIPTDEHGRNPSRITTMLHSFQAAGDGRRSVGVNESVFVGRSAAAHVEAQLSENVLNAPLLRTWPLSVVCMYDTSELDAATVTEMRRSHPVVRGQGANPEYEPDRAATQHAAELAPVPADVELDVGPAELDRMRHVVRAAATRYGLTADRVDDLVLAANEIVTNSLRHGGGHCHVAVWLESESAVCEVRDGGQITDPLIGRFAPSPSATSGRGLWLANHLCDLVQLRSSAAGTVVRLFVDR
ncbi:MAG TPA: sensor histidine kinase [Jatrophihabitans sp.]|jgi:anti-sigma regulatory factor (Ser/Thr protein kinase)|nr:sensor histidine kinase [Jatrophihabitans sp.]